MARASKYDGMRKLVSDELAAAITQNLTIDQAAERLVELREDTWRSMKGRVRRDPFTTAWLAAMRWSMAERGIPHKIRAAIVDAVRIKGYRNPKV